MRHLTITQRVGFATGFLCFVILALCAFATWRFASLRQVSDAIVQRSIPGMTYAGDLHELQAEVEVRTLQLLLYENPAERKALREEIADMTRKAEGVMSAYEQTISSAENRANFEALKAARAAFLVEHGKFVALVENDREAAFGVAISTLREAYAAYARAGAALFHYNTRVGTERGAALAAEVAADIRIVLIAGAVALVIGAASAVLLIVGLRRILVRTAGSLDEGAGQVAAAAVQVAGASQALASGAAEQTASLDETTRTLGDVAAMTDRNAASAREAKSLSEQTRGAAERGAEKVTEMKRAMDAIQASSDEFAKIVKTIDEIAFQTNVLALNAAVEAARAGGAGAGFAVVADEVRNLAQRAAVAAKETTGKIEEAVQRSAEGVVISAEVAQALAGILTKASQVDGLVTQIATASGEQARGVSEANLALQQVNKITQANASSAEESAAAAEELTAQAAAQRDAVGDLKRVVLGTKAIVRRRASAATRCGGEQHAAATGRIAAASKPGQRSLRPKRAQRSDAEFLLAGKS